MHHCQAVPFGEQVFDFIVGQGASRFQPEHGQSALRVIAAYHLAVEPHPARAALGTRAAGITAAEELVAREPVSYTHLDVYKRQLPR